MKTSKEIKELTKKVDELKRLNKEQGLKTSPEYEALKEQLKSLIWEFSLQHRRRMSSKNKINCPIIRYCVQYGTKKCNDGCPLYQKG